jgi:hypothetical protein
MALTETEWDDVIFYFQFMAKKSTFGLPALKEPEKVLRARKKELINEWCELIVMMDEEEIEGELRNKYAVEGVSIRAALNIVNNWKQFLLSRLTTESLLKARCLQPIERSKLDAVLKVWREKATNLKLTVVPNFEDNTAAGGVEMWISYKDIQNGAIPTMFALGHEFGHQTDFSVRDEHPEVLKAIYSGWSKNDHTSWEYYADSFSMTFLGLNSGDRKKLISAVDAYMGDEADDGTHPEGRLRMNQMRIALAAL